MLAGSDRKQNNVRVIYSSVYVKAHFLKYHNQKPGAHLSTSLYKQTHQVFTIEGDRAALSRHCFTCEYGRLF